MAQRDIVVIGASAGGTEMVTRLVRGLPAGLPAALLIVVHFPPETQSFLPRILNRAGRLPAGRAEDGERIEPGRIYIGQSGFHLQIHGRHVRLTRAPKENNARPSVDVLFRSAARTAGPRCIGVILSGNLDDGTAGLASIKRHGGVAVVQSPETAPYPGMPRSATDHVAVDHVVSVEEMPALLTRLILGEDVPQETGAVIHDEPVDRAETAEDRATQPGTPSTMSCPECHGVLWEVREGEVVHFRCRVGHAYSPETLLAHQADQLEAALWTALRSLEEHAALCRRMAAKATTRGHDHSASAFTEQAVDAEHQASTVRNVLESGFREAPAPVSMPRTAS